ncbi:MAG TPA: hypothetical protein VHQ98_10115 [Gaiellaceae bacterium]|jgi:hypothetical protein|nr:hypothetical protein [Gaiellaceae bacterium]
MEGYDVITSDDQRLGQLVRAEGDYLIVEHGSLRKKRNAIPKIFAQVDDSEHVVLLTVSKELVEEGPEVKDGEFDHEAVAAYYGLAETTFAPETLDPDDPDWSEKHEEERLGAEREGERRARMLEGKSDSGPRGRQIIPSDSHEEL